MKVSRRTWGSRWAAVAGVVALLTAGSVVAPPAAHAAWDSGQGFVVNNSTVQDRPRYTIRFANSSIESLARPYLQRSVAEIHTVVNTRITFGGVGPQTGAATEIYVRGATSGSCGSSPWGSWDGCGAYKLSSNYVGSSEVVLRTSAFSKSPAYLSALVAHELGHALGLHHTTDPAQLMHGTIQPTDYVPSGTYKTGDRNGLRFLARNTPAPSALLSGDETPGLREASAFTWSDLASPLSETTGVALP